MNTFTVVPPVTIIPLVTPEVVPTFNKVLIVFKLIFAVVPELMIPATVDIKLVEERVLIVFEVILSVPGKALLIPVTAPPVPVDDKFKIVFVSMLEATTAPTPPINKPVTAP